MLLIYIKLSIQIHYIFCILLALFTVEVQGMLNETPSQNYGVSLAMCDH